MSIRTAPSEARGSKRLGIAVVLAYIVWSHLVIVAGAPEFSLLGLLAVVLLVLAVRGKLLSPTPSIAFIVAALAVAAVTDLIKDEPIALYAPPVLIPLSLAVLFGRTLLPGRTPLVQRFAQLLIGDPSAAERRYMRKVTWFWTLVCGWLAAQTLLLAVWAEPRTWSLFANFLNYVILALCFVAEYLVRCARFGWPDRPIDYWIQLAKVDFRQLG